MPKIPKKPTIPTEANGGPSEKISNGLEPSGMDRIADELDPILELMTFLKPDLKDGIDFVKKVASTGGQWIKTLADKNIISEDQADMLQKMPTGIPEWYSTLDDETKQIINEENAEAPQEAPDLMQGVVDHNRVLQDAMNGKF